MRASWIALTSLAVFLLTSIRSILVYDLPTLFLFGLALIFMYEQRFTAYLVVFLLASVNRETAFVLTVLFFVWFFKRMDLGTLLYFCVGQALIFVAIQLFIHFIYQDLPGDVFWSRFQTNLVFYSNHPWASARDILIFGVLTWAVIRNWKTKPIFLRTAFVVLAPIFFVLFWIAGFSFEYRTFGEIYLLSVSLLVPNQWLRLTA